MWESRVPIELGCAHCPREALGVSSWPASPGCQPLPIPKNTFAKCELAQNPRIPKSPDLQIPDSGWGVPGRGSLGRVPGGGPWGGPPGEGGGPLGGVPGNLRFWDLGGSPGIPKIPKPKGWRIFGNLRPKGPVNVLVFAIPGLPPYWLNSSKFALCPQEWGYVA